jgi:peroxiredoxin
MKKSLVLFISLLLLAGCKQHTKFHVNGKIENAAGKVLYFEQNGIDEATSIDSVKLNASGEFSFNATRPKYPDFYRLKLDENFITFAVDSCEDITITGKNENFSSEYVLTGSETSLQIQKLRKSVMNIQRKVNEITSKLTTEEQKIKIADIEKDIDVHKEMARKLILQNPRSLAAYFAIYQQVNGVYLFSPYVKTDKPYCAAVATSFNTFMPEYVRSKNLYNLVMSAIKAERKTIENQTWNEILSTNNNAGYIDITLPDKNDITQKLSSLEGKVVLIDFAVFETKQNVDYTFSLRELYNKYNSRGFEIFQISLDKNKALWQQSVQSIPWICVRDENGPETKYIASYNVSTIPTAFVLNRKGTIIGRYNGIEEIKKAVEKNM